MVKSDNCDSLVSDNLRLVGHLCKRFSGRGVEYEDLYQAGCVGLIKAAHAFDKSLGFQFSTYAVPVILGEIRRLFRDGGSIKVSRSVKELSLKIAKEKETLQYKLCREPNVSEIAESLGVETETVAEAIGAARPTVSLTSVNDEDDRQTDIPAVSGEENLENRILLDTAISKLEPFEQSIIKLRYFEQLTQSETAKRLCMTQVGISRAEKKILVKLRSIIGSVA